MPERDIRIARVENVGPGRHRPATVMLSNFEEKPEPLRISDIPFATPIARLRHRGQTGMVSGLAVEFSKLPGGSAGAEADQAGAICPVPAQAGQRQAVGIRQ
jgi:hypothetical protein